MRISDWSSDVCSSDLRSGIWYTRGRLPGNAFLPQEPPAAPRRPPSAVPRQSIAAPSSAYGAPASAHEQHRHIAVVDDMLRHPAQDHLELAALSIGTHQQAVGAALLRRLEQQAGHRLRPPLEALNAGGDPVADRKGAVYGKSV